MRCAMTGASGYVGSRIRQTLDSQGFDVVELGRSATADVPFDLERADRVHVPSDVEVLIHCAWSLQLTEWDDIKRINIDGSKRLFQRAKKAGVKRIIFISTLSAFKGTQSKYGRSKLFVEKETLDLGGIVVRPGLIFGEGPTGGMVGSLQKLANLLPVLPMIGLGRQPLHWCHEDDLGRLIVTLLKKQSSSNAFVPWVSPGVLIAAASDSWKFADVLRCLAKKQGNHIRLFIPFPPLLIWAGLRTLEKLGMRPPFRSDSLISLLNQDPCPDFAAVHRVGVTFRDFIDTKPPRSLTV
jgi:nucleoside-diphosphate-sugar epimerase